MWKLIRLFLIEEIRLRRSFSSSLSLLLFPEIIFLGAMGGYIFMPFMEGSFTYPQIHSAVLGSLFMFGVSMGGIAFLGKEFIERSLGPVTMLAASINYQPVSEKRMYLSYFLHDLAFYIFLVLIPTAAGLLTGMIVNPMAIGRFLLIISAQWSTFLMGLALSMFVSSLINNRRRILIMLIPATILPLVSLQLITSDVQAFIPGILAVRDGSFQWILFTLGLTAIYVGAGTFAFDGSRRGNKSTSPGSYGEYLRFSSILYPRDLTSRVLLARELLGLVRGKAYIRIGFSLFFPLLVISGMIGIISGLEGVPVKFNLTFFAIMISFFTISIYSHLTNIDYLDFDQTLPVGTPALIKVKIRMFLILSLPVSLVFLLIMSLVMNDLAGLMFGIPLVLVTVPYMGYVTAYLTGLWTNSLLFDSTVFMRYMLFTVPPLMMASILSFLMAEMFWPSAIGISGVIIAGIIFVLLFRRGLNKKWKDVILSSSGEGYLTTN